MSQTLDVHALDLAKLQKAYDEGRFMDAYRETEALWSAGAMPADISLPAAILAARLSYRVGGASLSRVIRRWILQNFPMGPEVRYYCKQRTNAFDMALDRWKEPELEGATESLAASFHAETAYFFAELRDFETADWHMEKAESLKVERPWLLSCRAHVRMAKDDLEGARQDALDAYRAPGGDFLSWRQLLETSKSLEQVEESIALLKERVDGGGQSWELCFGLSQMYTQRHQMLSAKPEASEDGENEDLVAAMDAISKAESLTPLADASMKRAFNAMRDRIALVSRNSEWLKEYSLESNWPYSNRVAKAFLEAKEKGREYEILHIEHPVVFQKYDTCFPASMAMVLDALGAGESQDQLAETLTLGGTPIWRAYRWALDKGYSFRATIVDEEVAQSVLSRGIPFIYTMSSADSAHAVAAVGFDKAKATLRIREPGNGAIYDLALDQMAPYEVPIGPLGLIILPPSHADALDGVVLKEEALLIHYIRATALMEDGDLDALRNLTQEVRDAEGSAEFRDFVTAFLELKLGNVSGAIELLEPLFNANPASFSYQRGYFSALSALGNSQLMDQQLRKGIRATKEHKDRETAAIGIPVVSMVAHLAALRGSLTSTRAQAIRDLRMATHEYVHSGELYSALGHILEFGNEDAEACELAYRLSACLQFTLEEPSLDYIACLYRLGKHDTALDWLRSRKDKLAKSAEPAQSAETYLRGLVGLGELSAAMTYASTCHKEFPESASVNALALDLLTAHGQEEGVAESQAIVDASPDKRLGLSIQSNRYRLEGKIPEYIETLESLAEHSPLDRGPLLELAAAIEAYQGVDACFQRVQDWVNEWPESDDLQYTKIRLIYTRGEKDQARALIRERVKQTPHDVQGRSVWLDWELERIKGIPDRGQLQAEASKLLKSLQKLKEQAPKLDSTYVMMAQIDALLEGVDAATDHLIEAIRTVDNVAELLAMVSGALAEASQESKDRVWDAVHERVLLGGDVLEYAPMAVGTLSELRPSRDVVGAVREWETRYPADANVIAAVGEAVAHAGANSSEIQKQVDTLKPLAKSWPSRRNLQITLVSLLSRLTDFDALHEHLEWLCQWQPWEDYPYCLLADEQQRRGDVESAQESLERALHVAPYSDAAVKMYLRLLIERDQLELAQSYIQERRRKSPEYASYLAFEAEVLISAGKDDEVINTLRQRVNHRPNDHQAWLFLARVLMRNLSKSSPQEVIDAFERSRALQPHDDAIVFELTDFLQGVGRAREAGALLEHPSVGLFAPLSKKILQIRFGSYSPGKTTHIEALSQLLQRHPDFLLGWQRMLEWLVENGDAQLAKGYLTRVPVALTYSEDFHLERLSILQQSGMTPNELVAEWNQIFKVMPNSVPLRVSALLQFVSWESFRDHQAWADQALHQLAQLAPSDPDANAVAAIVAMKFGKDGAFEKAQRCMATGSRAASDAVGRCSYFAAALGYAEALKRMVEESGPKDSLHPSVLEGFSTGILESQLREKEKINYLKWIAECASQPEREKDSELTLQIALGELALANEHRWLRKWFEGNPHAKVPGHPGFPCYGLLLQEQGKSKKAIALLDSAGQNLKLPPWGASAFVRAYLETNRFFEGYQFGMRAIESHSQGAGVELLVANTALCALLSGDLAEFISIIERFGMHIVPLAEDPRVAAMIALFEMGIAGPQDDIAPYVRVFWASGLTRVANWSSPLRKAFRNLGEGKLSFWQKIRSYLF